MVESDGEIHRRWSWWCASEFQPLEEEENGICSEFLVAPLFMAPLPGEGTCPQCGATGVKVFKCKATQLEYCSKPGCEKAAGVPSRVKPPSRKKARVANDLTASAAAAFAAATAGVAAGGADDPVVTGTGVAGGAVDADEAELLAEQVQLAALVSLLQKRQQRVGELLRAKRAAAAVMAAACAEAAPNEAERNYSSGGGGLDSGSSAAVAAADAGTDEAAAAEALMAASVAPAAAAGSSGGARECTARGFAPSPRRQSPRRS